MSKTEYDILEERLADKDDSFVLAYMMTYAHAKALSTIPSGSHVKARATTQGVGHDSDDKIEPRYLAAVFNSLHEKFD